MRHNATVLLRNGRKVRVDTASENVARLYQSVGVYVQYDAGYRWVFPTTGTPALPAAGGVR